MSPVIAQMEEPLPMWIFVITSGVAGVLSLGLKVSKKGESKEEGATTNNEHSKVEERADLLD